MNLDVLNTLNLFNLSLGAHEFETLLTLMVNQMPNLNSLSTDLFQTDVLNDFFEPRHYSLTQAVFLRLDKLVLGDLGSFYEDNGDTVRGKKRGRYLTNYNYKFDLNDFERLFSPTMNNRFRNVSVMFVVDDCECFDENKIRRVVENVLKCFDYLEKEVNNKVRLKCCIEVRFKCESFVFNSCDVRTCKFRTIWSKLESVEYFQKFKINRNSIIYEI